MNAADSVICVPWASASPAGLMLSASPSSVAATLAPAREVDTAPAPGSKIPPPHAAVVTELVATAQSQAHCPRTHCVSHEFQMHVWYEAGSTRALPVQLLPGGHGDTAPGSHQTSKSASAHVAAVAHTVPRNARLPLW